MAVARWRQMRIWGIEKANMEHQMRAQAEAPGASEDDPADDEAAESNAGEDAATRCALAFRTLSDESRSLDLINRYESRYDRQYLRAHRRFLELADRRTPPPVASRLRIDPPVQESRPFGGSNKATSDPKALPAENLLQPRDTISAKQTRQAVKLMPSHSFAAAACWIILSALSFIPVSNHELIHEIPGRAATSSANILAGCRWRERASRVGASW
jgi:hypothetical protein